MTTRRMKILAGALLMWSVTPHAIAAAQSAYEPSPVLKATDLAPASMLKGPRFTVDERVPVANLLPHFVIRSDFGVFEAHGRDMLGIRVVEVGALDQLEKTSKTEEFAKAAGKAVARPVKAAANIVTSPVETAKGAPAAVGRFFDRVELGAKRVTGAAEGEGTTADKTEAVTKRVGGVTADVLGYEDERRALAKRLRVDPYTTNHVLSEKLNDVAWVAFSGRVGVNLATAVVVPFSTVLSATSITNDMVWDMKPADLLTLDGKKLLEMGLSRDQVSAMLRNQWYSISLLTSLVNSLESLGAIKGRDQVVAFASAVASEDRARLTVMAIDMLARHHSTVEPLVQLSAPGPIIAHTKSGGLLVPAPMVYLAWTELVAKFASRPDLKAKQRTLWVTGSLSSEAKRQFAAAGWTVREEPAASR